MATRKPWTADATLAEEVQRQFDTAMDSYRADPLLIVEHANQEESIRTGGYRQRTLLELVQNAADAMIGNSKAKDAGRVEIVLDRDTNTLYCANSGEPFTRKGIDAISHAYMSSKRGSEIGRFGLGFKSVLSVSDSPQVLSRSVAFTFNTKDAQDALRKLAPEPQRLPTLRTLTLLEPETIFQEDQVASELAEWATTIVRLPNLLQQDRLVDEMRQFSSEFLLFVKSVRRINLRILGEDGLDTSHESRPLGKGRLEIRSPNKAGEEWIVKNKMHRPSANARKEAGETVAREKIRVSVAVPVRPRRGSNLTGDRGTKIGRFWSYFPLQDRTSATGLFNAPWSVNDDRTNMQENGYNLEILEVVAELFVSVLPELSTAEDPAAHLDLLPARGNEAQSFGDEVLCRRVPIASAKIPLVPDASGSLKRPNKLVPLDFRTNWTTTAEDHKSWQDSPNTPGDSPHYRCYTTDQRRNRLLTMFLAKYEPSAVDRFRTVSELRMGKIKTRSISTWLTELSQGPDVQSSVSALRIIWENRTLPEAHEVTVFPTVDGYCSLSDRGQVFIGNDKNSDVTLPDEGFSTLRSDFVANCDVDMLHALGFEDLDLTSVIKGRLDDLEKDPSPDGQLKFWQAVRDLNDIGAASAAIRHARSDAVKLPTLNGGWAEPTQVLDIDVDTSRVDPALLLDRDRCVPELATELGVVSRPQTPYPYENEFYSKRYEHWIREQLGTAVERRRLEFLPSDGESAGPFSVLLLLKEVAAKLDVRRSWTEALLESSLEPWICHDSESGLPHRVKSPLRWAIEDAGILSTSLGPRPVNETVGSSLAGYKYVLPVLTEDRVLSDKLRLPEQLQDVNSSVLRQALSADAFPSSMSDKELVELVLVASASAFSGSKPHQILARVDSSVEGWSPRRVYVAEDEEQLAYLQRGQKPYLFTSDVGQAEALIKLGCARSSDSFEFSTRIHGVEEPQLLLDVFPGLRKWRLPFDAHSNLRSVRLVRADEIEKWVTTANGVEPDSVRSHLDDNGLYVVAGLSDEQTLMVVSQEFDLGLTPGDVAEILRVGVEHNLEIKRLEAMAAAGPAEAIECYFEPDDLKEKLPTGLWAGLVEQGLVDSNTSVAELCLSIYGRGTLKQLKDNFNQLGYPDVPLQWTGTPATVDWLRKMGFGAEFAGQPSRTKADVVTVPGATLLPPLHTYQRELTSRIRQLLLPAGPGGQHQKAMIELPTGAGKTRVATQSVLEAFIDGVISGPVLWIAQSEELCEQAVQTFIEVWRGLSAEKKIEDPLSISRLWNTRQISRPEVAFSVVVATDAKLEKLLDKDTYAWLANASAVVIDEGHIAGDSPRYTRILSWLGVAGKEWERPLMGLSATPFKGTSTEATKKLARRFGDTKISPSFDSPYRELVDLGVLAQVEHEVLEGIRIDLDEVEAEEARFSKRLGERVMNRLASDSDRMTSLVSHIAGLPKEWSQSVLVFTPNVLSAQVLAATLNILDVHARAISGDTGMPERRDAISQFKNGEIQVLTNCNVLTHGFDAPGVTALYIAKPTLSPNAYIQMAGRGLRGPENGGKDKCLIVDIDDNFGHHDINNLLGYKEYEYLWNESQL